MTPLGLVTQPSQYGQYSSGALRLARNVVMRNPGEIIQAADVAGAVSVGAAGNILQKMFPLDQSHVYTFHSNGTTWSIFENNNTTNLPAGISATNLFNANGRISPTRIRDRMIVNSLQGVLVGDFMAPASPAERDLRKAGLPQPGLRTLAFTAVAAGAIPNLTMVGYAICFVRELSNGYTIRSVPTNVYKFANTSGGTVNPILSVYWNGLSTILAGDKIEIYRTDGIPSSGFFGYAADPGATFKLVASVPITAPGANTLQITDSQPFQTGTSVTQGRELYTNPGQEGPTYSNRQPPIAQATAAFKGFTFYARTTDRPKWGFSFPGGIGSETNAGLQGFSGAFHKQYSVGRHNVTGSYVNTVNTVTGVAAADFVGLVVGQFWGGTTAAFPTTATITNLNSGAGVITMSVPSTLTAGPLLVTFDEAIELNGTVYRYADLSIMFSEFNANAANVSAQFGRWEITADQTVPAIGFVQFLPTVTVSVEPAYPEFAVASFTIRGTNGARFSPPIPDIAATALTISATTLKNHLAWSKDQQPEHVPTAHETFTGNGEIIALNATRDALWIWCTDGLYRFSGDGGADGLGFRIDIVDTTLILAAPQASCVLNEVVFAYTNVGYVSVDSAGTLDNLTDKIIGDLLPGAKYIEVRGLISERNEFDEEVLLILGENGNGNSDTVYVFNVKQRGWTTLAQNSNPLSNLTAMAMMRDPAAGQPRFMFATSPPVTPAPSYANWNDPSNFLLAAIEYQPLYADAPLDLKQWIWVDFLFALGTATNKNVFARFNGVQSGFQVVADLQTTGYARVGIDRPYSVAHAIAPGFQALTSNGLQSRFQGISIAFKQLTNQSKNK